LALGLFLAGFGFEYNRMQDKLTAKDAVIAQVKADAKAERLQEIASDNARVAEELGLAQDKLHAAQALALEAQRNYQTQVAVEAGKRMEVQRSLDLLLKHNHATGELHHETAWADTALPADVTDWLQHSADSTDSRASSNENTSAVRPAADRVYSAVLSRALYRADEWRPVTLLGGDGSIAARL
jgi:hypothetical protein